ncbi:aminotransferase class V-fold PLP-dependent enzyme [Pseudoalteromonas sp. SWYJ118]|uniref:aminotransferase class V-fold PLP-dependent enzyme n=1 Tax=unclassified Pseudoalteromonas TaxID=194690 RepID=UPI0013FE2242|nr:MULTISPECIES: aminotransferase class V-fold PLP-dependent enzyme [unclassified Pseudoalteromonas]MBH0077394.1 aminotransferase class V-fold PLP-dependent enzyme [Pseudoalteromonas sp. SWYJ118]
MLKNDFCMADGCYLLNHSVGRPLKNTQQYLAQHYFLPWESSNKEPWQQWLPAVEQFTTALGKLFNTPGSQFCPQVNLSSGLTKLLMSHPRLQQKNCKVLMAQSDFPSMGFAMQKALPECAQVMFIPEHENLSDISVWQRYITADIDLVFISHVYSNTGVQAPVYDIVAISKLTKSLSIVDVAQSAGVIPLDLSILDADFMIGSSVKWLCGGPGAAYLWVNKHQIAYCEPKDVGWFSHQNPFEFDINHFEYNASALKFWGGTPSVAPYIIAANSIAYFAELTAHKVREHNLAMLTLIHEQLSEYVVSPMSSDKCSGTVILFFAGLQEYVLTELDKAKVSVDFRKFGIRVSPHIYNTREDVERFISIVKQALKDFG